MLRSRLVSARALTKTSPCENNFSLLTNKIHFSKFINLAMNNLFIVFLNKIKVFLSLT